MVAPVTQRTPTSGASSVNAIEQYSPPTERQITPASADDGNTRVDPRTAADGRRVANDSANGFSWEAFIDRLNPFGGAPSAGPKPSKGIQKPEKEQKPDLDTVKGCAQFLLDSKNVGFWDDLSTGSERANLERLAKGKPALVETPDAVGDRTIKPNLDVMQALVDMAKKGPIQINALTGGDHSSGSNHYTGNAVDLDVNVGDPAEIEAIANQHGGTRNSETTHIHLDFV